MKIHFHPEATDEFEDAVNYYEEREPGLGLSFSLEIQRGIELISDYPDSWPFLSSSTRRFLVKQFPYGIIYSIYQDTIYILAVMHLNRKPGYWEKRN